MQCIKARYLFTCYNNFNIYKKILDKICTSMRNAMTATTVPHIFLELHPFPSLPPMMSWDGMGISHHYFFEVLHRTPTQPPCCRVFCFQHISFPLTKTLTNCSGFFFPCKNCEEESKIGLINCWRYNFAES